MLENPRERKMWIAVGVAVLFAIGVLAVQWKQTVLREREQPVAESLREEFGGAFETNQ